MNQLCLTALFLLSFTACNSSENQWPQALLIAQTPAGTSALDAYACAVYGIQIAPGKAAYTIACKQVLSRRQNLARLPLDTISAYFTESYLHTILPYWYGTTWSFEGYTSTPRQGEIACSYLVSTTLAQMGLNINRYKVAQLAPYPEALSYAAGDTVHTFNSVGHIITSLKGDGFGEGFYFLGMAENHAGLLLKRKGELFFIHSNYIDGKVVIELAGTSAVFSSYTTFYVANLSHNERLMRKWVSGQVVEVIGG